MMIENLRDDLSTMTTDLKANAQRVQDDFNNSITPLIGGILEDSQLLLRQEIALVRAEATQELSKAKRAGLALAVGGALGLIAALLCGLAMVQFLALNFPTWPSYSHYAVVALVFAVPAALALLRAKTVFDWRHVLIDVRRTQ